MTFKGMIQQFQMLLLIRKLELGSLQLCPSENAHASLLWLVATQLATGNRNRNRNCESVLRFGIEVSGALEQDRPAAQPEAGS